jgi:hypothetical protein
LRRGLYSFAAPRQQSGDFRARPKLTLSFVVKHRLTPSLVVKHGLYAHGMLTDVGNEQSRVGLCASCCHVRRVESDRGSVFFLCQLALSDSRFRKYPRLPVLACDGYQAAAAEK